MYYDLYVITKYELPSVSINSVALQVIITRTCFNFTELNDHFEIPFLTGSNRIQIV